MNQLDADQLITTDNWSDLSQIKSMPQFPLERLHAWRRSRLQAEIERAGVAMLMLVNPVSLRYALDYRCYALFQSHIPTSYAFIPADGPTVLHNAYDPNPGDYEIRLGQPLSFFDGGFEMPTWAGKLADDIENYLHECGTSNRKVALEAVNPLIANCLLQRDIEVVDGAALAEHARVIKSADEIACMRWSIAVAEHGIQAMCSALKPGVSELQLWGILNYANLANDGDWHDGRMLASGPRINPWLQEASQRKLESGDLLGFDTDMVGPFGYFADISRTLHCGPAKPTARQKQLYRLAFEEVHHNIGLIRAGLTLHDFQQQAWLPDEQYHQNAYTCLMHGVGMCDEYPRVNPVFRGETPYDGMIETGMVLCIESYIGATGERDGVKLEQQVLVTDSGCEVLTQYPFDESLLN